MFPWMIRTSDQTLTRMPHLQVCIIEHADCTWISRLDLKWTAQHANARQTRDEARTSLCGHWITANARQIRDEARTSLRGHWITREERGQITVEKTSNRPKTEPQVLCCSLFNDKSEIACKIFILDWYLVEVSSSLLQVVLCLLPSTHGCLSSATICPFPLLLGVADGASPLLQKLKGLTC